MKKPEPVCDLLRQVLRWALPDEPRQRSFAKYAFLVGTQAALSLKDFALVRQAWLVAEQISESPIEGDDESRGKEWQSPFEQYPNLRSALDVVLTGAADQQSDLLRAKAAEARARGTPNLDISDVDLALLAKSDVKKRIFHDSRSGEVWFLHQSGFLLYFDGYDVVSPPVTAMVLDKAGWVAFLQGAEKLDQRFIFWDNDGDNFAEIMRYGDRVVYSIGINNGLMGSFGFGCSDSQSAAAFAEGLCGQPDSMKPSDPWYLVGKGVIVRTLYTREGKDKLETVVDGCWHWDKQRYYSSQVEGVAAYEQYELESIRDRGAWYGTVEWMSNIQHPSNHSIADWMSRIMTYGQGSDRWLLELPARWHRYLTEVGLAARLQAFHVELGPPASEAELAALTAACETPLPEDLVELWQHHATSRWQFGDIGCVLLSPSQFLEKRKLFRSTFASLHLPADVIMTTLDGRPSAVIDADEDLFACFDEGVEDLNWSKLSDVIVDAFVEPFARQVIAALPETKTLNYWRTLGSGN